MKTHYKITNKKQTYFILYFFFILILFYAIQDFQTSANIGIRDAERRAVHISLLIILICMGIYYIYTLFQSGVTIPPIKKALWSITIWIIVVNLIQRAELWRAMVHIGLSVLWILVYSFFSYYLSHLPNSWSHIQFCTMAMFAFYVFSAFYASSNIQRLYNRIAVVNLAYNVIVFLPWLSLISKNWIRRMCMGIVFTVVLVSMKRGALIVFPIMIITYFLVNGIVKKKGGSALLKIIGIMILFIVVFLIFDKWTGSYFSRRFTYESLVDGSGRAQLYRYALEDIKQRSFLNLLIGRGSGSSIQFLGTGVHNEWLEFIFSFGIIGAFLYLLLFISLFRQVHRLIRTSSFYASSYTMAVIYMFVVGLYGGIYFVHSTLYIMAFFGAIEGLVINDVQNERFEGINITNVIGKE